MTDSSPPGQPDLPAQMELLFGSDCQDKYVAKLRELAFKHSPDLFGKSGDKLFSPGMSMSQSISPTPSTGSNSSSNSNNIRHFKKALIMQSNFDGTECKADAGSDGSFGSESDKCKTDPETENLTKQRVHRASDSPFDVVNLLALDKGVKKFKKEEVEDEEEDDSDDEKKRLTIVTEGDSIEDIKPSTSETPTPVKMDFSIRSLTSNTSMSSSSMKYNSEDEDNTHNRSSVSLKTDNDSITSDDQDLKSEDQDQDDLKPIVPENFDFLRPNKSGFSALSLASPVSPLLKSPRSTPSPGPSTSFSSMPLVPTHVGRKPLNGPPCSLKTLVDDGILDPLDGSLSYEISGSKFMGDLLANGFIRMTGSQQVFANPSSWANYCRSTIPACSKDQKNYGSAWSIIRYLGKRLDSYKLRWYRKQKKQFMGNGNGSSHTSPSSALGNAGVNLGIANGKRQSGGSNGSPFSVGQMVGNFQSSNSLTNMANLAQFGLMPRNKADMSHMMNFIQRDRLWKMDKVSVGDTDLNNEMINDENVIEFTSIDLNHKEATLKEGSQVAAVPFNSICCVQPFLVNLCTNALLLIDFHAHLATTELNGYLGGSWDPRTSTLTIQQAFPLRYCKDDSDYQKQTLAIKESLATKGCTLVGWYHTHPDKGPHPSVNDIKRQLKFQKSMLSKGKKGQLDYTPLVSLIVSPFNQRTTKLSSLFQTVWVMPLFVNSCKDFGRPMQLSYTTQRDNFLTQDLLVEMRLCATALQEHPKFCKFSEEFRHKTTLWDKLYHSLGDKLPRDLSEVYSPGVQNDIQQQALTHFWTFLKALLLDNEEDKEMTSLQSSSES